MATEKTELIELKGYHTLKRAVEHDCLKGEGCFNPNGCDKEGRTKCNHRYCDTFKWVLERAEHYSDNLGIPVSEILTAWEEGRDYWYMSYYQDSHQPRLDCMKCMKVDKWNAEGERLFGNRLRDWRFVCPKCGTVQSGQDFFDAGVPIEDIERQLGYSCIGRFNPNKGCD